MVQNTDNIKLEIVYNSAEQIGLDYKDFNLTKVLS